MKRIVPASLLICLVAGCGGDDERLLRMAKEHEARQAEQNLKMAKLQKSVADGSKRLVEADAESRDKLLAMQDNLLPTRPPWASNATSWKANAARLPSNASAIRSSPPHSFRSGSFWPACCLCCWRATWFIG